MWLASTLGAQVQNGFAYTADAQPPRDAPVTREVYRPASGTGPAMAVPQELMALLDADAPVSLPPPGRLPSSALDNRQLDKLVAALGRNRTTWRRALQLYEWLQVRSMPE